VKGDAAGSPNLFSATPVPTPSLADYAKQYEVIVAPVNEALTVYTEGYASIPPEVYQGSRPLVGALQTANAALVTVRWPASVAGDMATLVADDIEVMEQLNYAATVSGSELLAWEQDLKAAFAKMDAATAAVHADLGMTAPTPIS